MRLVSFGLAAATSIAVLASCSALIKVDTAQCATDDDCHARGAAFASAVCLDSYCQKPPDILDNSPWGCLDREPARPEPNSTFEAEILVFDAFQPYTLGGAAGRKDTEVIDATLLDGINVRSCNTLDPTCARPLTSPGLTKNGRVTTTLQGSFTGFFELTRDDLMPTLAYTGKAIAGETRASYPLALFSKEQAKTVGAAVGADIELDPSSGLGSVFFIAFDCRDLHTAGTSWQINKTVQRTRGFYLIDGLPSLEATQTDASGSGGWINIPEGTATVTTTRTDGKAIQSANVLVRSGSATLVWIRPRGR